jgi:hypothetical protein
LRPYLSDAIQDVLETEVQRAVGAERYARVTSRLGYRHGSERRDQSAAESVLTFPATYLAVLSRGRFRVARRISIYLVGRLP